MPSELMIFGAREYLLSQVFPDIHRVVDDFVEEYFTAEWRTKFVCYRHQIHHWIGQQSLPQVDLEEVPELIATDSHPKLCADFIDPLRSRIGSKVMKIVDMRGSLRMGHLFNDAGIEYSKRVLYRDFFYSSFTEWTNPLSFYQDVYLSLTRFDPEEIQEAFSEFPSIDFSSVPDFIESTSGNFEVSIPQLKTDIIPTLQSPEFVGFLADLHRIPEALRADVFQMTSLWTTSTDDQAFAIAIGSLTEKYPDCMNQLWAFHQHYLECAIRLQIVFGAKNGNFHKKELPTYKPDLEKLMSVLIIYSLKLLTLRKLRMITFLLKTPSGTRLHIDSLSTCSCKDKMTWLSSLLEFHSRCLAGS